MVYHFRSLDLITVSCLIRIFNKVHSAILVFPVTSASVGCCHTQVYVCIMHFTLCCVFWINKQVREECVGVYALKQRIVTGTENNPLELNRFKQLVEPAFDSRPRWFTHITHVTSSLSSLIICTFLYAYQTHFTYQSKSYNKLLRKQQ